MIIPPEKITLKNGRQLILRSPDSADAESVIKCRRITSGETYFIMRYPEEIDSCVPEIQADRLEHLKSDPRRFMLAAFDDKEIVGSCGLECINSAIKTAHRAKFGISILRKYCGQGLGSIMLKKAIELARFEQIELGVFEDNHAAIGLYEKFGFKRYGVLPKAYKLKDGTYRDEIQMILLLSEEVK